MKGISNKTIRWIFTGFFALSAATFFPSMGSTFLALAAVLCAPIARLDDFFRGRLRIKRGVRIAITVLLFVVAIPTTPRTDATLPSSDKEPVVAQANIAGSSKTSDDVKQNDPVDAAPDADDAAQAEPDPAPVAEQTENPDATSAPSQPEPEPQQPAADPAPQQPAAQPEPDPEPTPSTTETTSRTVYVGDTGECYHTEYCRTLKGNKYPMSLDDAIASGRRACKVCGG